MNCIDYVLWLSLDPAITNFPENVLIGAFYLPLENSRFFTIDEFDMFENNVVIVCCKFKCIINWRL
jgi:hypothetical protein